MSLFWFFRFMEFIEVPYFVEAIEEIGICLNCPVAQFARSATWPAVVTRTCQVASMRISPSPLTYAATKALRPPGSVGGDPIPAVVISAAVAGRAVQ